MHRDGAAVDGVAHDVADVDDERARADGAPGNIVAAVVVAAGGDAVEPLHFPSFLLAVAAVAVCDS